MIEKHTKQSIVDLERWRKIVAEKSASYQQATPYPHTQIDHFLEPDAAQLAMEAFPPVKGEGWIHYLHVNEKKHGLNKMDRIPAYLQEVIRSLNSPEFVAELSKLTGIKGLMPDPTLEGGGLHQSQRGGYLNIHADFTVHPHKRNWRRRVNLLVYLNEGWQPEYKGDLELWTRDMKKCERKISPVFNRCVIFNTDADSYHGLPEPIECPEDMTRKSIALYYFTEEENIPTKRGTNYRARPGDGFKSVLIYLDKKLVNTYSRVKGALGINDDFVSKVLGFFNRKK
jgi:Rps23 Pro-64 3,4-dihydroxylase Tpa1-like proline 4-hydroxylase